MMAKGKAYITAWLILPSLLVTFALWAPFGFSLTALIEEWGILGLFARNGVFFIADTDSPIAAHALRPLTILPHAIAYSLDSNSFDYWHVLLIASLVIKGATMSHLIWKTTGSLTWGSFAAVLLIIYPADTMQLAFRGIHINLALAVFLVACSLQIAAFEGRRERDKYLLAVCAAALSFLAVCMYEAVLPLMLLPFTLMFISSGGKTLLKTIVENRTLVLLWVCAALGYVLYVFVISPKIASYQGAISGGGAGALTTLAHTFPKLFSVGLIRSTLGGWFDAFRILWREFTWFGYLYIVVAASLPVLVVTVLKAGHPLGFKSLHIHIPTALTRRMGLAGLVMIMVGYIPFLVSPAHLVISQRTFLLTVPGAALVCIALLMSIERQSKRVYLFVSFALLAAGLASQLFQFGHYVRISNAQRALLRSIVEGYDQAQSNKTLVILDESNQLNQTWMFLKGDLLAAVSYFLNRPISGLEVCYMPDGVWKANAPLDRTGRCIETENSWVFQAPMAVSGPGYIAGKSPPDIIIPKENVYTIKIAPNGVVHSAAVDARRAQLLISKSTEGVRYRNILIGPDQSFGPKLWKEEASDRYKWSFGDWWSLELPTRGSGWREAAWDVNTFFHVSSAWKASETASLLFDFVPKRERYILRGRLSVVLSDEILQSIKIKINRYDVNYNWLSRDEFEATLSSSQLLRGSNTLQFTSNIDPQYYGLSFALDWVEIAPPTE